MVEEGKKFIIFMEQGQTLFIVQLCVIWLHYGRNIMVEEGDEFIIFVEKGQTRYCSGLSDLLVARGKYHHGWLDGNRAGRLGVSGSSIS